MYVFAPKCCRSKELKQQEFFRSSKRVSTDDEPMADADDQTLDEPKHTPESMEHDRKQKQPIDNSKPETKKTKR